MEPDKLPKPTEEVTPVPQDVLPAPTATSPEKKSLFKSFKIPKVNLKLVLILLVVLALAATAGYLYLQNQSLKNQLATVATPTPLSSPEPSAEAADPTADWEVFQSNKIQNLSFPAFSLNYPSNWQKSVEEKSYLKFSLLKNNYAIQIIQDAMGGTACLFNDSPSFEGTSDDLRSAKYTQFETNSGLILRRYKTDYLQDNLVVFNFCQKETNSPYFVAPGQIASIQYLAPQNYNEDSLKEMDEIIKTLKTVE
ncbi:MAG: hypothetical protein UW85_C0024G0003 [Parcubacteria group bacterium GW2011_GWA1_Parcubacteria_45_10]|nr:MAG: hypothetical protein UW85_C0024G0003 [Parcubacteria group bacterium GW2011_GWA1_Parcubacteria_45_10]